MHRHGWEGPRAPKQHLLCVVRVGRSIGTGASLLDWFDSAADFFEEESKQACSEFSQTMRRIIGRNRLDQPARSHLVAATRFSARTAWPRLWRGGLDQRGDILHAPKGDQTETLPKLWTIQAFRCRLRPMRYRGWGAGRGRAAGLGSGREQGSGVRPNRRPQRAVAEPGPWSADGASSSTPIVQPGLYQHPGRTSAVRPSAAALLRALSAPL